MIYYLRFETHAVVVETQVTNLDVNLLKVDRMYQLLSVPSNITNIDGTSSGLRNVKLLKFDKDMPGTYSTQESTGVFYMNIRNAIEVTELSKIPELDNISETELAKIYAEHQRRSKPANTVGNKY